MFSAYEVVTMSRSGTFPGKAHVSRKYWKKRGVCAPIFLSYLQIVMTAVIGIGILGMFVFVVIPRPRPWWLVGFYLGAVVPSCLGMLITAVVSVETDRFVHFFKDGCDILGLHKKDFVSSSAERLRGLAEMRLRALAAILKSAEALYPSYHEKREAAKREFERAYRVLVEIGVIENIGYGYYFK